MHTFKFNHNDYVTVTLTKDSAEHLTQIRHAFNCCYPNLPPRNTSYKEGICIGLISGSWLMILKRYCVLE